MKRIYRYILLGALALAVYILPLGARPLLSPDESRYAEIPREMIAGGDYLTPRLNGVRYFEKTPLSYWCFAASFKLFGRNRFALRLPCMLAMFGTAWLIFLLLGRYYARGSALLGAAIFVTLPFVAVLGSVALTDMFLTFFVTAALAVYFAAVQDEVSKLRRSVLLGVCGLCCGLAFLAKGFIAFAIPVLTVVPYLLWEKKWKMLFTTLWLPLLGAAVMVLPWGIAIHLREPDFWRYFFWVEHVQRYCGGAKAQHQNHLLYFIPVFFAGISVWTLMLPDACRSLYRQVKNSPLVKFALGAFVMPLLFFSCSSGKLATYILPCFAPASILLSAALQEFFIAGRRFRAFHLTLLILAVALPLTALGLWINLLTGFPIRLFLPEEWGQLLLVSVIVLLCLAGFYLAWQAADSRVKLYMFLVSLLPVIAGSHFIFPAVIRERAAPTEFLSTVIPSLPRNAVVVVNSRPFQDVCWALRSTRVVLFRSENEIEYGLSYPDTAGKFIPDPAALKRRFLEWQKQGRKMVLVSQIEDFPSFAKILPAPVWVKKSRPGSKDGFLAALY